MKRTVIVDLSGIKNEFDLGDRFYIALGIGKPGTFGWSGFDDYMRRFDTYPGYENIENLEIHLVITGWEDIKKLESSAIRDRVGQSHEELLLETLRMCSDPTYRNDKLKKFSFEIID